MPTHWRNIGAALPRNAGLQMNMQGEDSENDENFHG